MYDLTMDECVRVNNDLLKAAKSASHGALKDILNGLKESEFRGKLKVRRRGFFHTLRGRALVLRMCPRWRPLTPCRRECARTSPTQSSAPP